MEGELGELRLELVLVLMFAMLRNRKGGSSGGLRGRGRGSSGGGLGMEAGARRRGHCGEIVL